MVANVPQPLPVDDYAFSGFNREIDVISYDDLVMAFEYSDSGLDEPYALIHGGSGEVRYIGDGSPDEYPESTIEEWVGLPSKYDLGLSSDLVHAFIKQSGEFQTRLAKKVSGGKGFFRRFRKALIDLGLLDRWYAFEEQRTRKALLQWASENGLEVRDK